MAVRCSHKMISILLPLFLLFIRVQSQCPNTIQSPCSCSTTRYEPVSIVCDNADSLATALQAIGTPPVVIDSLVITNTPIIQLPAFAFQGLAVKRLVFRNNDLQSLHPQSLTGQLPDTLTELELRNNKLGEVPVDGISTLRNLRSLSLAKNGITTLNSRAFASYASASILHKLDLSGNRLNNISIDVFTGLNSITEISLDKNFLTAIPTDALMPLRTLEDLSLGVNQLQDIPPNSLPFPNLKSLSLEVNSISYIPPEVFQGTPNLLYLYLSANRFNIVDSEMFQFIPSLKVLAMGNNELRNISQDAFRFSPELVRLELSECQISSIDAGAFQSIPNVQVIVLNKNRLRKIYRNQFQGLSQLVSLDLKGNGIQEIEDRSFAGLSGLKHLDLSANRIQTLPRSIFAGTLEPTDPPTTRVVYIYENPWVCDGRIEWFRKWLRDNMDVMVDAPGYPPSVCRKPAPLFNWPMRSPNPPVSSQATRATTAPFPKKTTPVDINNQPYQQGETTRVNTGIAGVNLAAVILGIILGVLLLSVLLLMVVRYFVSKNRRDRKQEDEEARRLGFGSTVSGYHSAMGSAYPSPATPSPSIYQPALQQQRTGYFLNRPWYWWF